MRTYYKAYYLKDLRHFHAWRELTAEGEEALADDMIVYLRNDLMVVKSPVLPNPGIIWSNITAEWQAFCQTMLHFEIPADLRSGSQERAGEHGSAVETVTEGQVS